MVSVFPWAGFAAYKPVPSNEPGRGREGREEEAGWGNRAGPPSLAAKGHGAQRPSHHRPTIQNRQQGSRPAVLLERTLWQDNAVGRFHPFRCHRRRRARRRSPLPPEDGIGAQHSIAEITSDKKEKQKKKKRTTSRQNSRHTPDKARTEGGRAGAWRPGPVGAGRNGRSK